MISIHALNVPVEIIQMTEYLLCISINQTQIDKTSFRLGGSVFAAKAWRFGKQCFTMISGTFFNRAVKSDLFPIMAGAPSVHTDLNFSHFI